MMEQDHREPLLSTGGRPRRAARAVAGAGVCGLLIAATLLLWPRRAGSAAATDADRAVAAASAKRPARLTIANGCAKSTLWIAGFAVATPIFPDGDIELAAYSHDAFHALWHEHRALPERYDVAQA